MAFRGQLVVRAIGSHADLALGAPQESNRWVIVRDQRSQRVEELVAVDLDVRVETDDRAVERRRPRSQSLSRRFHLGRRDERPDRHFLPQESTPRWQRSRTMSDWRLVSHIAGGEGPADTIPPRGRRVFKIALVLVAQSVQAMVPGGIALFLPLIRHDAELSFTEAGALAAASQLVYALMQIPAGYLTDRFGARRLFILGLVGSSVLALSFAELHSFVPMLLNQALMGFFRPFVFAPGLLLMMSLFPACRRATAMGLYVAGGFSSSIFLNVLCPFVVGPLGWRLVFVLFSTFGLAAILLFWRLGPAGPPGAAAGGASLGAVLGPFKLRVMWLIGGIQFTRLAVVSGLSFWLPTLIVTE